MIILASFDAIDEHSSWELCSTAQVAAAVAAARRAYATGAYRKEWSAAGVAGDDIAADTWTRLPILSKESLVDAARHAPPYGDRLGVPREAIAHVFAAPGPFYMPFTADDLEHIVGSFA